MYQAKRRGGGTVEVFGEVMRMRVLDRMNTEHSLHRALERRELRLFYQPVVEINGARAVGVEALLRWEHPEQGLVAPNKFIPVAEESGLIIPIGAWVLHEACRQLCMWRADRFGGPRGRGRGQPLGPTDRPSRDHLDGRADPRRHRAAAGQPDPGDHRERADERCRLCAAGAPGAQGPGRDPRHRRLRDRATPRSATSSGSRSTS